MNGISSSLPQPRGDYDLFRAADLGQLKHFWAAIASGRGVR
jgi:hypothetical protein